MSDIDYSKIPEEIPIWLKRLQSAPRKRIYTPKPPKKSRYVITPKEARALGYKLP